MDTTFVYNIPEVTISDTITALVTNMPEKIGLSDEVLSVYDSIQLQLNESNAKIDSLYHLLESRSADGWGIDQIVAIIAIPLMIAIFAFTLPLLFSAAAKIEKAYQCEAITMKLEGSWQRKLYMGSLIVSIGVLILMMLFPTVRAICIWTLPILCLVLVTSVLLFYNTVSNFSKPYWVVERLNGWFKGDYRKTLRNNVLRAKKWKVLNWTRKKDDVYLKIFKTFDEFNSYDPYWKADKRFYERLYALLLVAVNSENIELVSTIRSKWYEQIEQSKFRSFEKEGNVYWQFCFETELFSFHEKAITLLGQCSDSKFQDIAIANLYTTLDHAQLPWESDIMRVLHALVFLPRESGVRMVRRYMFKAHRMYMSVRRIPQMSYVCGEDVEHKKDKEIRCRQEWNWIRNIHYLLSAYWWNKGGYELLSAACPKQEYRYIFDLFPVSGVDVLYQHIHAMHAIESSIEGISEWQIGELFDTTKEEMMEIVNRYTTFLMYYTAHREKTYYPEAIEESVMDKVDRYMDAIGHLIDDKKVRLALEAIHMDVSCIPMVSYINECRQILLRDVQEDEYSKKINIETIRELKRLLSDSIQLVRTSSMEGIYRVDDEPFPNEIGFNKCSLKMDKPFFTLKEVDDHAIFQTSRNIANILSNRYLYAWLSAISQMHIETVDCDALHFKEQLIQYTGGDSNTYIVISLDSPFNTVVYPYYHNEFIWVELNKFGYSYCGNTKLFKENERVIYVMRIEDLPSLQYEPGHTHSECTIQDESSKKSGDLSVRFEIDPHLRLCYDKTAKVLRIRSKRTKL